MRALLLAASTAALTPPTALASTPTAFVDIHQITSFTTGSIERGFLFRIEASESTFAGRLPKGPKWSTHAALTGGEGKEPDHLKHATMKDGKSSHPSHRLMLPPDVDRYLCNEAKGTADYTKPAGNAAASVYDAATGLSGYEGNYVLVPRGRCTFEAKARSAQRMGASGVIVRNTLGSRYGLVDEDAALSNSGEGPDWVNTKWPVDQRDYECGNHHTAADRVGWRAEIEAASLDFVPPPYDGKASDALLTGPASDGNLCAKQPNLENFQSRCPSMRCLLTGNNVTEDGTKLEACCAWDMFVRMSTDGDDDGDEVPQDEEEDVTIPALFVTMEHGDELYDVVVDAAAQQGDSIRFVTVVPYGRWYPSAHYSGVIVWALALFALWISSYESAKEYRTSWKKISRAVSDGVLVFQRSANSENAPRRERAVTEDTVDLAEEQVDFELAPEVEMANQNAAVGTGGNSDQNGDIITSPDDGSFTISDDADVDDFVGNSSGSNIDASDIDSPPSNRRANRDASSYAPVSPVPDEPQAPDADSSAPTQRQPQQATTQSGSAPVAQNLEINALHAVLFVICASFFLFVLFFFNLDKVIRVLYGLGGSVAMNQIMFYPLYDRIVSSKFVPAGVSVILKSNAFGNLPGCRGEYFKWIDILSAATGYALGIAWIIIGLTRVQPMTNTFYWIMQDVMGVCFCILILGLIHINTIMVASVLLCLVFIYDIFYVLITPLIFGSSVMIDVATGANGMDPTFCEKYPLDKACRGALAPLPMLLAVPWFNDFRGGFSMLGFGDIILPGLLISFAARYDSATSLVRKCSQTSSAQSGENAVDSVGQVNNDSSGGSYHYHLGWVQKVFFRGYFGPLVIAYGIALMVAYVIVWTTKRGQPALLYLVPACLGTMLFLGWRRRELSELWSGPKVMKKANKMVAVAGRIPEARPGAPVGGANASLPESASMV